MPPPALNIKLIWSLVLAIFAALVLTGINELSYQRSSKALQAMEHAKEARLAISNLLQNILDAESGQRGFMLTREEIYREPYDQAIEQVKLQQGLLQKLYADHPAERRVLTQLNDHLLRKLTEMDVSLRLVHGGNIDASQFVLTTDVGRSEMAAIRTLGAELIAVNTTALLRAHDQIARTLLLSRIAIAIVTLAGLAAFVLYLRRGEALRNANLRQQEALKRERNLLEQEVKERTASLAELASHLQEVRENERGFLARELHDELGALLTAAKLDVARLRSRMSESPDAVQRLQHLTELLNSGISLKRRIIEDLRPSSLSNLGLAASLDILGREFSDRANLDVQMTLDPVRLNEGLELSIYRMVQESLTNVGKYAQATQVTVTLKRLDAHVSVEVSDNGLGFTPQKLRTGTHGLAGIRHRIEAAGGTLHIISSPGQGTRLQALLPVPASPP